VVVVVVVAVVVEVSLEVVQCILTNHLQQVLISLLADVVSGLGKSGTAAKIGLRDGNPPGLDFSLCVK
jgi:hypothetical protein